MTTKRIYLTHRNPAISAQDFPREWRRHAALAASFSTVNKRYLRVAQCTKFEELPLQPANDYAGVALLWMESLEAALQVNQDPDVIQRLRPDEVRVFGSEVVNCALLTEERVLQDGPAAGVVVIEFLARAAGTSAADFAREWQGPHAQRVLQHAGVRQRVRRYAQDLVVVPPPPGYAFDGVSELWFDTIDDALAVLGDAAWQAEVLADRARWCDEQRSVLMPTRVTHSWPAAAT